MRGIGALTAALIAFTAAGCRDNRPEAAALVLEAFQGACVSRGAWTDNALHQNQALINVMRSLQDSRPCREARTTLASLQGALLAGHGALSDPAVLSYRAEEERLQTLTLALASTSDPTAVANLHGAIVAAQVSLADAKARARAATASPTDDAYFTSTRTLAMGSQSLLAQSDALNACLRQSPAAAVEIGTSLLGMAGSFISPLIGAGAAAIGNLINIGIEFARDSAEVSAVLNLHRAQLPSAMACGLEAMTELHCSASDAFDLLELQAQAYSVGDEPVQPLWQGIDLLGRRMPMLSAWLQRLRNGVTPSDPYDAQRQIDAWSQLQNLDNFSLSVNSSINLSRRIYLAAPADQQTALLQRSLTDLAFTLAGEGSPFTSITSDPGIFACILMRGLLEYTPAGGSCPQFVNTVSLLSYVQQHWPQGLAFDQVVSYWQYVHGIVNNRIWLSFTQAVTADPRALLAAAWTPSADNMSAMQVLQLIERYIGTIPTEGNPQMAALIADTHRIVTAALAEILDASLKLGAPDPEPSAAADAAQPDPVITRIATIFDLFQLRRGLAFFSERMNNIVRWDLLRRLERGEIPRTERDILRAAGGDLRDRLTASGVTNLERVNLDINNARTVSERNIDIFREYFRPVFHTVVEDLAAAARRNREPATGADRPNGQMLGHICTLIYATGGWPDDATARACRGAVLYSVYPDPARNLAIRVDRLPRTIGNLPLRRRLCVFHRFLRASRLTEALRGRSRTSSSGSQSPSPVFGISAN